MRASCRLLVGSRALTLGGNGGWQSPPSQPRAGLATSFCEGPGHKHLSSGTAARPHSQPALRRSREAATDNGGTRAGSPRFPYGGGTLHFMSCSRVMTYYGSSDLLKEPSNKVKHFLSPQGPDEADGD